MLHPIFLLFEFFDISLDPSKWVGKASFIACLETNVLPRRSSKSLQHPSHECKGFGFHEI